MHLIRLANEHPITILAYHILKYVCFPSNCPKYNRAVFTKALSLVREKVKMDVRLHPGLYISVETASILLLHSKAVPEKINSKSLTVYEYQLLANQKKGHQYLTACFNEQTR